VSTPPTPGGRITVRVDQGLSDDLQTLARCGLGTSDAVRQAVQALADIHRSAWLYGLPYGSPVEIISAAVQPVSDGRQTGCTGASDNDPGASYPQVG
jgi:hypothetical protein